MNTESRRSLEPNRPSQKGLNFKKKPSKARLRPSGIPQGVVSQPPPVVPTLLSKRNGVVGVAKLVQQGSRRKTKEKLSTGSVGPENRNHGEERIASMDKRKRDQSKDKNYGTHPSHDSMGRDKSIDSSHKEWIAAKMGKTTFSQPPPSSMGNTLTSGFFNVSEDKKSAGANVRYVQSFHHKPLSTRTGRQSVDNLRNSVDRAENKTKEKDASTALTVLLRTGSKGQIVFNGVAKDGGKKSQTGYNHGLSVPDTKRPNASNAPELIREINNTQGTKKTAEKKKAKSRERKTKREAIFQGPLGATTSLDKKKLMKLLKNKIQSSSKPKQNKIMMKNTDRKEKKRITFLSENLKPKPLDLGKFVHHLNSLNNKLSQGITTASHMQTPHQPNMLPITPSSILVRKPSRITPSPSGPLNSLKKKPHSTGKKIGHHQVSSAKASGAHNIIHRVDMANHAIENSQSSIEDQQQDSHNPLSATAPQQSTKGLKHQTNGSTQKEKPTLSNKEQSEVSPAPVGLSPVANVIHQLKKNTMFNNGKKEQHNNDTLSKELADNDKEKTLIKEKGSSGSAMQGSVTPNKDQAISADRHHSKRERESSGKKEAMEQASNHVKINQVPSLDFQNRSKKPQDVEKGHRSGGKTSGRAGIGYPVQPEPTIGSSEGVGMETIGAGSGEDPRATSTQYNKVIGRRNLN